MGTLGKGEKGSGFTESGEEKEDAESRMEPLGEAMREQREETKKKKKKEGQIQRKRRLESMRL